MQLQLLRNPEIFILYLLQTAIRLQYYIAGVWLGGLLVHVEREILNKICLLNFLSIKINDRFHLTVTLTVAKPTRANWYLKPGHV